jgi:hypothetical protein
VVKCFDHKDFREVAVKINRNSSFDHNNSKVEIGILKKIKEGVTDGENSPLKHYRSKIVRIEDSFVFRSHYVRIILKL